MNARIRFALYAFALLALGLGVPVAFAQGPSAGQTAPEFSLPALDGKTVALSQFADKVLVVHFGATWCPFCNAEAPHLQQLSERYRDKGVQVLVIDVKEPQDPVARMAKKFGFTFPVLLDADGGVAKRYAPPKTVLPDLARDEVMIASNLIIDRERRIRFFSVLDTRNFDAKLVELRGVLDKVLAGK